MNILVAGFQHETNTFAPTVASYESFVRGEDFPGMVRGERVFELLDVNVPISGFIHHVRANGHSVTPVIWAGAGASAHVTTDAYERIAGEILATVKTASYDAIYLDLHGAMVTQHLDDGEGELLARIRAVVGPAVKIVASLDSHANVTTRMLALSDGLVAYRTYPHIDMADTGRRAGEILLALMGADKPACQVVRRVPFLIPVNSMSTMLQPARGVYDLLEELEAQGVLSLSFAPGFPAADFPECGPVVWGYGFDQARIEQAVDALFAGVCVPEEKWAVQFQEPEAAVRRAMRIAETATRPVILADTQDNPGVGGDSNTTGVLRTLLKYGVKDAAIGLICDPVTAAAAHAAGVGATIDIALGGCPQVPGDEPLRAACRVEALADGKFVYGGPMMNGKQADLGPMACLRIDGVRVAVSSSKAQMLDRNMYRTVGIAPEDMKILVNKSSVHFRADFAPIAEEILVVRSPGPFVADPSQLPWRHLGQGMRMKPNGPAFSGDAGRGSDAYQRLEALGIELPTPSAPAAAYLPFVRAGQMLYLSGHLARLNGQVLAGRLGDGLSTAQGIEAARATATELLSTLHAATGDLNKIMRIVKLTSFVASAGDFTEQHLVTNGASQLFAEVFGDKGAHARSAVGVAQLPLGACVEIELIAQLVEAA
ncbi:Atu1372/SO_1960 family protein [Variovorax sp. J22P240]|uniref:Atu1372/SO_1960 family protein n=1 Tax=Variovorax sp. J22P240 TaxID=3053514 RepID=UPI002577D7A9|nr:Atu1372/SO_1960 family protein [Variovorax sp. J22P240]MDM0001003.1 Atu1372/SO_1960 family protein [Variovorax sp. J22P240]